MFPYRHMALYGWGVTLFSVSVFTPLPSSCPLSVSLIHSRRHPQPTPPPHCLHGLLCKHMKCCHLVTWAECDQGQAGCRDQMEEFKLWSLDHAPLGSGLNFYLYPQWPKLLSLYPQGFSIWHILCLQKYFIFEWKTISKSEYRRNYLIYLSAFVDEKCEA